MEKVLKRALQAKTAGVFLQLKTGDIGILELDVIAQEMGYDIRFFK